jgi:hypothetical protein
MKIRLKRSKRTFNLLLGLITENIEDDLS